MTHDNWPEITSAFAIGIGVGAMLGLMLAPKSGAETRKMLHEKAQKGIGEAWEQGKRVARKAHRAREFVHDAVEAGHAAYREAHDS